MVTRVENTVLYNWNLLREQNLNVLTEKKEKRKIHEVMDGLITSGKSFQNVNVYQNTMMYTFKIL